MTDAQMKKLLSEMRELHKLRTEEAAKQTKEILSEMRELHKLTAEALQAIINHQNSAPSGGGATKGTWKSD
ncbi:hypothetical protein LCGC14_2001210 [marine sediment metagenome]|uniref:Uncharacterized protein n=1 Tax=marine sediment metagenome TaxID=412755 RepID=A0A0F9FQX7_9ZZZZ